MSVPLVSLVIYCSRYSQSVVWNAHLGLKRQETRVS